jgi:hypothetical protein
MYNGQAQQDKFVVNMLNKKRGGAFLEIGSQHPIYINNSYVLENEYNWRGIMIEYEPRWLPMYQQHRPKSIHIMNDATTIDYKTLFETTNMPKSMDYLQIDLEVVNRSTLTTLEKLDRQLFDDYTFATITMEHDIYVGNHFETREKSREIFKKRGYLCVLEDIHYENRPEVVWEDWYVYPPSVDMDYVNKFIELNKNLYTPNPITGKSISSLVISYPESGVNNHHLS